MLLLKEKRKTLLNLVFLFQSLQTPRSKSLHSSYWHLIFIHFSGLKKKANAQVSFIYNRLALCESHSALDNIEAEVEFLCPRENSFSKLEVKQVPGQTCLDEKQVSVDALHILMTFTVL